EEVLLTVNQLLADLDRVLERHQGRVMAYLGGGFFALVREGNHAERAVRAALEMMAVVQAFNQPRAVLGLRPLPPQLGVASGPVYLGNIGTYRKLDYTAIGAAVNLAQRLMREMGEAGPCVSQETYDLVRDRFEFVPGNPRTVDLRGLGVRPVWDVV